MANFSIKCISFLKRISLLCWEKPIYRHLLFGISTLLAIIFMGYHFGTFDQAIHIPFLKKYSDPTLYPNDPFFDMRFIHVSFFWFLFIPLYRIGVLEISMFATYFLVVYLTFWMLWKLSKTLFQNPLVSFLSVVAFIFPHVGFGMLPIIEFSLLNRTFVLPFLLFALDLYLRKKYLSSYFLLGVLYNFHVISVNFVLAMILFDCLLRIREIGIKKICCGIFLFIIAALPVLIWKTQVAPVDLSIQSNWYLNISNGLLYHLFAIFPNDPKLWIITLSGFGTFLLYYLGLKTSKNIKYNQIITNFTYAVLIILLIEFITSQWLPIVIIIQSQIVRAGLFVLLFGYLFFINHLVISFTTNKHDPEKFFYFCINLLVSGSPIMLAVVWIIHKWNSSLRLLKLLTIGSIITLSIALFFAFSLQVWYPGIYIFAKKGTDYDVQLWAKNNTKKNALFITPPHHWWFYDLEWRVISERSTISTLSELAEAAFSPEYIPYWSSRFDEVAPGARKTFNGNVYQNKKNIAEAYYKLTESDFVKISKKYNASYVVVEKPHKYDLPLRYENSGYRIYQLSQD